MATVATRRKCVRQKVDKWWPDAEGGPIYHAPGECYWQCKNCLTLDLASLSRPLSSPGIFLRPSLFRAILILLSSTFDTRNSEIIEVVAAARKLCVKYVGDVGVLSHPVRKNESNFPRAKHHGIRRPTEPVAFLPRHNCLLSLPIAARSNASIADDAQSFARILKKSCFHFRKLERYSNNLE